MKLNKLVALSQYDEIVAHYSKKGCLSNDYLQREAESLINEGKLYACCLKSNAFLFVQKEMCLRVYYYLNDFSELTSFDGYDVVTEILYRGGDNYPQEQVDYLKRCGFDINLVRDQYSAMYKDLILNTENNNIQIETACSLEEVRLACELFNDSFDHFSGDYIAEEEYGALLEGNNILIAKSKEGVFMGALHQTVENRVAWLSHVAVRPEARGCHVGKALVEAYVRSHHVDDRSRYMLWVQHQNIPAVRMYQQIGFKYLNKSTLSMIKHNN